MKVAPWNQYEIEQERSRHRQALANWGEYSMFVLLWGIEDHESGLVGRCPTCYLGDGNFDRRISEAYGQGENRMCEQCFGTTFARTGQDGGVKAKIVRLSIWDMNEVIDTEQRRGEVELVQASVQATDDFRLRKGDYIFRADGTRWRVQTLSTNHLRAGFDIPTTPKTPLGYNFGQVILEDKSSVAYLIPPSKAILADMDRPGSRVPQDWSHLEVINASLVHEDLH